jgi:hypothetical protein
MVRELKSTIKLANQKPKYLLCPILQLISLIYGLPPAVNWMNHERLPQHCKYCVMIVDAVTRPEYGILSILTILSHIVLAKFAKTMREIL